VQATGHALANMSMSKLPLEADGDDVKRNARTAALVVGHDEMVGRRGVEGENRQEIQGKA